MARARNIKPSIMDNEDLAELEPLTRLLFIYLWMLADREGRLEDRPKRIAAQALAYDRDANADLMLSSLEETGFITRYSANGISIIQINAFAKHQTPHVREAASTLPSYEQRTTKEVADNNLGSDQPSPRPSDSLIPDSLIPDTGFSDSKQSAQKTRLDYSLEQFEEFWRVYPNRPGSSKADSLKAWKARIKDGAAPEAMIQGAAKYSAYCVATATEHQFIKQPSTFLGPGKHYESDWAAPARASPRMSVSDASKLSAARAIFGTEIEVENGNGRIIDITPTATRSLGG